jgi:hypothetical protein
MADEREPIQRKLFAILLPPADAICRARWVAAGERLRLRTGPEPFSMI